MRVLGAVCSWVGQGFRCQPEGKRPRRGLWGGGRAWPLSLAARGLADWAQRTLARDPSGLALKHRGQMSPPLKGECSLGTISTPPQMAGVQEARSQGGASGRREGRDGGSAPQMLAFLPLSGKRGGRPISPGSLPKGLHACLALCT